MGGQLTGEVEWGEFSGAVGRETAGLELRSGINGGGEEEKGTSGRERMR